MLNRIEIDITNAIEKGKQEFARRQEEERKKSEEERMKQRLQADHILNDVPKAVREAASNGKCEAVVMYLENEHCKSPYIPRSLRLPESTELLGVAAIVFADLVKNINLQHLKVIINHRQENTQIGFCILITW